MRYLVFACERYERRGGAHDFEGGRKELEAAKAMAQLLVMQPRPSCLNTPWDFAHVFDTETLQIVYEVDYKVGGG